MKDWSADKIIALGITLSLLIIVIGADIVAVYSGDMSITSLGKELVIGLFGYMGGGAIKGNNQQVYQQPYYTPIPTQPQNQVSSALNNVANTAGDIANTAGTIASTAQTAQNLVDTVETLTNGLKKK
jgi:hypothetical protein